MPDPRKSQRPKISAAIATKPKRIMSREELGLPMPSEGKRKEVIPEPPPPSPFPLTDKEAATFLEIRTFEAHAGHNWWIFAYARETWVEFKRRGKPSIKNLPQHVDDAMRRKAEQYDLTLPAKQGEAIHAAPQIIQSKPQMMSLAKPMQSLVVPRSPVPIPPKSKVEGQPSNKEIVYRSWIASKGLFDIAKLISLVPDVLPATVKGWVNAWGKGKNLPACTKH